MSRVIAWFSCGAASATATALAIKKYGLNCIVACCDTRPNEHPDNYRFSQECEDRIFEKPILFLKSEFYETVDDVFTKTRYMAGVGGARCTTELKKKLRQAFERPDDIHVFGYTANEGKRIREFEERNPELRCEWPLKDNNYDKDACYDFVRLTGIRLPRMYELGFKNNNCIACVKASSPAYWALTYKHFPDDYQRRAEQAKELGVRLVEISHHNRIFLHEFDPTKDYGIPNESVSCGPECGSPGIQMRLDLLA